MKCYRCQDSGYITNEEVARPWFQWKEMSDNKKNEVYSIENLEIKKVRCDICNNAPCINLDEITAWNQDQILHIQLVQKLFFAWITNLINSVIIHDNTKFSPEQYETFLKAREGLMNAKNRRDKQYAIELNKPAIQAHISTEQHHPKHWDDKGELMPVHQIINMYFDWMSRSIINKDPNAFDNWWDDNMKLCENQPHAKIICEQLRKDFPLEKAKKILNFLEE